MEDIMDHMIPNYIHSHSCRGFPSDTALSTHSEAQTYPHNCLTLDMSARCRCSFTAVVQLHQLLSNNTSCCPTTPAVVQQHQLLSNNTSCCPTTPAVVQQHQLLSNNTSCCPTTPAVVQQHQLLSNNTSCCPTTPAVVQQHQLLSNNTSCCPTTPAVVQQHQLLSNNTSCCLTTPLTPATVQPPVVSCNSSHMPLFYTTLDFNASLYMSCSFIVFDHRSRSSVSIIRV